MERMGTETQDTTTMTTEDIDKLRAELERVRGYSEHAYQSGHDEGSRRWQYDEAVEELLTAWDRYMSHELDVGDVDDVAVRVRKLRSER